MVFALTGFSFLFVQEIFINFLTFDLSEKVIFRILFFVIFSLPVYNLILIFYGFVFGQFSFFWNYEKKIFRRLFFVKNKNAGSLK